MAGITFRPSFGKDMDALQQSARKIYQRACEILTELQRGAVPSAKPRAETRVPKCRKYELPDGYRLVLQETDAGGLVTVVVGKHDYVESYLNGHKGYVFEGRTARVRELRTATADETSVQMVPSEELDAGTEKRPETQTPLYADFTDEMLLQLGVPKDSLAGIRTLVDPDSFECMMLLQNLAEKSRHAADALLAFATGNPATRQTVIDLGSGSAILTDLFPEKATARAGGVSEEFITFNDPDELRDVLERGTLEQWQLFLHPDQRSLVNRAFAGPARIRGISGSGKTVVGLHRARRAAKEAALQGEKVLFTTFDKGLAAAASRLLDRLCGPERSAIEVTHLHRWCLDYLAHRAVPIPRYSPTESRRLRREATGRISTNLQNAARSIPYEYLWDEVDFLMGRFLHEETEGYLATDRSGRGRPLTAEQRNAVLEMYRWYHEALGDVGFVEPADFVRMAYRQRRDGGEPRAVYRTVIVDEVQDLSELALRLLHSLVGDKPDGLLLVGDTTQRIFTRGYSMRGLGIDIAGRGLVLRKNYRNTRQILQAAFPLVESEWKDDIAQSGTPVADANPEFSVREGCRPIVVACATTFEEGRFLATEIAALLRYRHYTPRDICVLARNRAHRDLAVASLRAANIPVQLVRDPEAGEVDPDENAVRVSSLHGAKGHEFGSVFVIGAVDGVLPLRSAVEASNVASEAAVLYVGMTRARDLLYISHAAADANRKAHRRSPFIEFIAPWCDFARYGGRTRAAE